MGIRRTLGVLAVGIALTATVLVGGATTVASEPVMPAPYLASFRCGGSDPARVISVSGDGGTYRGFVNWVPEHFGAPVGAPWEVEYADGVVRLVAHGQYLPLPGQPGRLGTMTLTAEVNELTTTVTHTGGGPGSGDSNDQQVHQQITRALEAVGTAHLEFDNGSTYEVAGCTGSVVSRTMARQSDPRAQVAAGSTAGAWCTPSVRGDRIDDLTIDTSTPDWQLVLGWYDDGGTPDDLEDDSGAFYSSQEFVTLARLADGTSVDLVGENLDGEPVSATATFGWTDLTTTHGTLWSGTWTQRSTATSGPLRTTVEYDDGSVFEPDCLAYQSDYRRVDAGGGSPPTARPPANDAPAGAVSLDGATIVQTSGATVEAEEANPCVEPWEEMPDYRATHTVWFMFTGDGPTTVDTDGTRFDTALAVYTRDDTGALTPVDGACNDDWYRPLATGLSFLTLQARSTFDAEPGTTYFLQVGGVSSDDNYGTLRVSVGSP